MYQSFVRYIHAGLDPVSDIEILDRLSCAAERAGVKKPVELCVNPLISSPLLLGFFRPCIVLPRADIPEKDFPPAHPGPIAAPGKTKSAELPAPHVFLLPLIQRHPPGKKGLVCNLIMGDLLADEEYEELKGLLEKGKGKEKS